MLSAYIQFYRRDNHSTKSPRKQFVTRSNPAYESDMDVGTIGNPNKNKENSLYHQYYEVQNDQDIVKPTHNYINTDSITYDYTRENGPFKDDTYDKMKQGDGGKQQSEEIDSNTYSHLQDTCNDIDDNTYDHAMQDRFPDTPENDYSVSRGQMSEDDYDVSGNHYRGCLLIDAGKAAEITCPSDTVIDIFNVMYNYSRCQNDKIYYSDSHYKTHCTKSFECNLPTEPYRQKRASIYFQCRVNKPVDDRTTKSNVVKPVDVRTTESYVDNMIPGQDSHMESHGRKHKARRPNKKKGITKINITCDITDRQKEPENYERAYLMNSPAALHLATSHEGNLDRTDDNLRSNDVNLCQPQERSIMINDGVLKEDSTTYSHLRKIMDDSDVMYDHTVHIAVHDTCDGDYGVAHRGITEDDYDVSGNYHQSLSNNADPVYN
ncbi:unnamed protein product [Mytilus edulis]|uniref:Uncharacterized protein n=1 Tax=Mytilus edulis TaxID=6550 RepID=A0A8S3VBJ4_MYTED|nr:unnamed protein product [Mytilus edulis]